MSDYKHTPDMGEISGFGGGYEANCQTMFDAGVKWVMDNKVSVNDIKAHTYSGVYGLVIPDNDVAKALDKVITDSVDDCTGAMVHAVTLRVAAVARLGWDEYCKQCREHAAKGD
jgi:hypothetical protein